MGSSQSHAQAPNNPRGLSRGGGLVVLRLIAWVRATPAMRIIYRCLPQRIRDYVTSRLAARAVASFSFPNLVERPASREQVTPLPVKFGRGVNLVGYLRGQFGIGENARFYARALMSAGYRVALVDMPTPLEHGLDDRSLEPQLGDTLPYPTNLIFANPDSMAEVIRWLGAENISGRHTFACWFWELERFPVAWSPALADVDEIIVATRFVQAAVRGATDKPVTLIPVPIDEPQDSGRDRAEFGLGDAFTFLCAFDFNSHVERKNPLATIHAFRKAFARGEPVILLVKSSNGFRFPAAMQALVEAAAGDERILLRDQILDRSDVHALQRCVDAYVSLHRSEGFGLGMAECMRLGKPVIATAYSGNADFMTVANSVPVPFTLVPVAEHEYVHSDGQHWAEPDVASASAAMLRVYEDKPFRDAIGRQAALDIRKAHDPAKIVKTLISRLESAASVPASFGGPTHIVP